MARTDPVPLRDLRDWLSESVAEARAILPYLLDLPLPVLRLKLAVRPVLRTAGMTQCLLDLADQSLDRFRRHAFELTSIAVEIVEELVLPPHERRIAQRLRGQAWKTHARALHSLERLEAALDAIAKARAAFETDRGNEWYLATADSIEAAILHGLGRHREALALAESAAAALMEYGDSAECTKAMVTRMCALWALGHDRRNDEHDLWQGMSHLADDIGDETFLSLYYYQLGVFELWHGSSQKAWERLSWAAEGFRELRMTAETIAAHRGMAEAALHLERPNDAISELYKAYGDLLRIGPAEDTAAVGAHIVSLLLAEDRIHEADALAAKLPATIEALGLRASASPALHWLRDRARCGELGAGDAVEVRHYFEDLFLRPNAAFEPPERPARRIVYEEPFERSIALLGPRAHFYVRMLVKRIAATLRRHPVTDGNERVFHALAHAHYPALRIFYTYDDDALRLKHIEVERGSGVE